MPLKVGAVEYEKAIVQYEDHDLSFSCSPCFWISIVNAR